MAMDSPPDVLEAAFDFPTSDDDWVVTVLVGGVFNLLGQVLFLPLVFVHGYLVAAVREVLAGEDLPEWGDVGFGDVLVYGLKLWGVFIVYSLVLALPAVVLGVLQVLGEAVGRESTAATAVGLLGLVTYVVWGVLGLVVSYSLPAAVVNFARHGSFRAAFDLGTIRDVVTETDYVLGWLLSLVVFVVVLLASIAFLVVGFLTLGIGLLLFPWVGFFFNIPYAYVWAHAYAGALDLDVPLDDVEPAES